jgi:Domain of unknown function (DUF4351)
VRRYLMCECVEAYLNLEGPHLSEFEHLLQTPSYRSALMVAKTSFEKGRDCGRAEEQVNLLRRLLSNRFGPLSDSVWKRIEDMSVEQRTQLAEDFVTATSLEELGLGRDS